MKNQLMIGTRIMLNSKEFYDENVKSEENKKNYYTIDNKKYFNKEFIVTELKYNMNRDLLGFSGYVEKKYSYDFPVWMILSIIKQPRVVRAKKLKKQILEKFKFISIDTVASGGGGIKIVELNNNNVNVGSWPYEKIGECVILPSECTTVKIGINNCEKFIETLNYSYGYQVSEHTHIKRTYTLHVDKSTLPKECDWTSR